MNMHYFVGLLFHVSVIHLFDRLKLFFLVRLHIIYAFTVDGHPLSVRLT